MTTFTLPNLSASRSKIRVVPTREEMRAMISDPAAFRTVVRCLTFFASLTIGGVVFLAYTGHDTAVIGAVIGGPLLAVAGLVASRLKSLHEAVTANTNQQNGTDTP